ncbi:hypothetical protein [Marinomonas sp.]
MANPQAAPDTTEAPPKKRSWAIPVAFTLCLFLSISASSGIAYLVLFPEPIQAPLVNQNDEQQDVLISQLEQNLAQMQQQLNTLEQQGEVLSTYLRHSSANSLKHIMIDQEVNIQAYLKVMKSAIDDLAKITPRTRKWNEEYQIQLDLALKGSLEREDLLKLLKTGDPAKASSP